MFRLIVRHYYAKVISKEGKVQRRLRLKCDGTRAEIRFRFRRNRRLHLNRRGASVQSTTGSRAVRISGSNAGYTMFRGSVKSTGYPLHSPVSTSLPLPCVTVSRHVSNGPKHWGAFAKPLFQWKSNKCYVLWMFVCSLRYPASDAHALYFYLWTARFYHSLPPPPHYLLNDKILGRNLLHMKMCALIFCTEFVRNTSHSKNWVK